MGWQTLQPNEHADWLNPRNPGFESFIPLGDKDNKNNEHTVFAPIYSRGLETARDAWCYSFNKSLLYKNIIDTIQFYNDQRELFTKNKSSNNNVDALAFVKKDTSRISCSRSFISDITNNREKKFKDSSVYPARCNNRLHPYPLPGELRPQGHERRYFLLRLLTAESWA